MKDDFRYHEVKRENSSSGGPPEARSQGSVIGAITEPIVNFVCLLLSCLWRVIRSSAASGLKSGRPQPKAQVAAKAEHYDEKCNYPKRIQLNGDKNTHE